MSSRRGYRISVNTSVRQSSLTPVAHGLCDGQPQILMHFYHSNFKYSTFFYFHVSHQLAQKMQQLRTSPFSLRLSFVFAMSTEMIYHLPEPRSFFKHIHYWEIIYFNLEDIFTIRYEDLHGTISGLVIKRKGSRLKFVSPGAGSPIPAVWWQAGNSFSRFPFLHLHIWCEDNNPGALGLLYNKR